MFDEMDYNDSEGFGDYNQWDKADKMALKAYELYDNGHMPQAFEHLSEAICINPNNSSWHFNAGLTLDALDEFEKAIECYNKALELNPDDPEILNSIAVDYTRLGLYDLAISVFERIQEIDPEFEPGYCNRIITYTEIDMHDKAEEMFYLAQQIAPECPICFYNIGNSLFSRNEYKRAIWCWERTELLDPTHPQINYRIAQAYWANGDKHLAQIHFLNEIRNNPGDTDVILEFGLFLLKKGDIENAKEKFNRVLELDPCFANALFYLAEAEKQQGDMKKAQGLYRQALCRDPKIPGPRYRLAQLAIESGDNAKAAEYLRTEMGLNIEDNKVLLSMGKMFLELEETDFAAECFLRIVDENRSHPEAFRCLGLTLAAKGEIDGAVQFLEHSILLRPDHLETTLEAADAYLKLGAYSQAGKTVEFASSSGIKDRKLNRMALRIKLASIAAKTRGYIQQARNCKAVKLISKASTGVRSVIKRK